MCECIVHFLFLAHIIEKPFVSSERECKSYLFDVEVFLSFYFFFSLYLPLPLALLVDFLINDFSAQCPKERGNIPCIITLYATRWRENHKFPNVPEYPNSFSRRKNWILCFFFVLLSSSAISTTQRVYCGVVNSFPERECVLPLCRQTLWMMSRPHI